MRKIHIVHKIVLGLLFLLLMIVAVMFLINKREIAIAESHNKYSLTLNKPLELPIRDFSKYGNRPLVIDGIFDIPVEINLNNGKYSEWSLQIRITKKATAETTDLINYSAVQSKYAAPLYKFSTDALSSVTLLLTKLEKTGGDKINIDVGREFNIDCRTVDQILLIPLLSLTAIFTVYLVLVLRTYKAE